MASSRLLIAYILAIVVSMITISGVFSYRPSFHYANIGPPSVWFEDPQKPGVSVHLYKYKTGAIVNVYGLRTEAALLYRVGGYIDLTDPRQVEENFYLWQLPGGTCTFYVDLERGVYLQARGNPTTVITYPGCLLEYKGSVHTDVIAASFTLLTMDDGVVDGIRGVILLNSTANQYYMAGLRDSGNIWYFGVYKNPGEKYTGARYPGVLGEQRLTGSVSGLWFAITILYVLQPDGSAIIRAWLYNLTNTGSLLVASLVTMIEVIDYQPIVRPDKFGITVYQIRNQPSAYFQMVSFTYSYVVRFEGLRYSCTIEILDRQGIGVGYGHAGPDGVAVVSLNNPILPNALVVILCGERRYEARVNLLLGGDVYDVRLVFYDAILYIYALSQSAFTGHLLAEDVFCDGRFRYVMLGLHNTTYATTRNITITPPPPGTLEIRETNPLLFRSAYGELVGRIGLRVEMYIGSSCTIRGFLVYNWTKHIHALNEFEIHIYS